MKKTLVVLSAFLIIGLTKSIASEGPDIDPRIVSAFQKEFSFAKEVSWEVKGSLSIASFLLNDQRFVAWYNAEAELVTTARNILYMQLPLTVIKSLEQFYADATLSSIIEFTIDNETFYQVTAERKGKKFLLKASPSGTVSVIKKIK